MATYALSNKIKNKIAALPSKEAWQKLLHICIKKDIPLADIAEYLEISKVAVYGWVKGEYKPNKELNEVMGGLGKKLTGR